MSKPVICFICDQEIVPGEKTFRHPIETKDRPICEECALNALMERVDVAALASEWFWTVEEVPEDVPDPAPEPIPVLPGQMDMWGNEH